MAMWEAAFPTKVTRTFGSVVGLCATTTRTSPGEWKGASEALTVSKT